MARALVVEDNSANKKLTTLFLHSADHSVLSAVNAETGLRVARDEQPDLILMDIQLPGMDGLVATAILKEDPDMARIPIVALSALAMKAGFLRRRSSLRPLDLPAPHCRRQRQPSLVPDPDRSCARKARLPRRAATAQRHGRNRCQPHVRRPLGRLPRRAGRLSAGTSQRRHGRRCQRRDRRARTFAHVHP
jgi:CheY-like chemotaxis protein